MILPYRIEWEDASGDTLHKDFVTKKSAISAARKLRMKGFDVTGLMYSETHSDYIVNQDLTAKIADLPTRIPLHKSKGGSLDAYNALTLLGHLCIKLAPLSEKRELTLTEEAELEGHIEEVARLLSLSLEETESAVLQTIDDSFVS